MTRVRYTIGYHFWISKTQPSDSIDILNNPNQRMLCPSNQLHNDAQVNYYSTKSAKRLSGEDANRRTQLKTVMFTKGMNQAIASLSMDSRSKESGS